MDAADPKIRSHVRLASLDLDSAADRATVLALVLDNQGCVWFDLTRQVVRYMLVHNPPTLTHPMDTRMHGLSFVVGFSRGADPVVGEALSQGAASVD